MTQGYHDGQNRATRTDVFSPMARAVGIEADGERVAAFLKEVEGKDINEVRGEAGMPCAMRDCNGRHGFPGLRAATRSSGDEHWSRLADAIFIFFYHHRSSPLVCPSSLPSLLVALSPPAVPPPAVPLPRRPPRRRPRRRSLRRRTPTWASLCSTEHLLPVLPLCNASGFGMLWQVFGTEKGRVDKGRRAWYQGLFLWTNQAQR